MKSGFSVRWLLTTIPILLLCYGVFSGKQTAYAFPPAMELSAAEKQYLHNHTTLRVQLAGDWPPFNYTADDAPRGYVNDYIRLIGEKLGLSVDFVAGRSWSEYVEMLADKKLDCITNMTITPEREERFLFSRQSVVDVFNALLTLKESTNRADLENLQGGILAVARGYAQEELLRRHYPDIELLLTDNLLDSIRQVMAGKADAAIGAHSVFNFYIAKHLLGDVASTPITANIIFPSASHHLAVHPDNSVLLDLLDKADTMITKTERKTLRRRWYMTGKETKELRLTPQEQSYLADKKALRICVDPDWMPIESIRSGRHTGMTADYMELLSDRMGISFKLEPTTSWKQTLEYGEQRRCDLISLAMSTPERRLSFYFSTPYFTTPLVLATRTSAPFFADISLAKGKRIGVKKDYAFGALFRSKYKDLEIIDITSLAEGLVKVRDGKLYGVIGALPSVAHTLQKSFTDELKISGKTGEMLGLRMALRNDEPELVSSMNKAIATIDEADHQKILNRWISVKYEKGTDYTLIITVVTGSLLIIGLLFYRHVTLTKFNSRLRQQNTEIRRQSKVLQKTQQQLLMTQHAIDTCSFPIFWLCRRPAPQRGSMVHANASAAGHLGYSLDEFLQLTPETILARDISTPGAALFEILDKNTGVPYKTVFRRRDGSTFPVELHCSSFNYEDNRYLFIFYNDISIQQEMETKLHRSMKMEAVGMLAGGVAHDLNNILSGIVSYPELLLLQLEKDDPMRPKLEAIQRSGQQAAHIVDDLLTMARSGNAAREVAGITTIVEEYCTSPEFAQLQQRYPEVECTLELAEDVCNINCSPLHIKKAIMNLVVNGYEATLPGGYVRIATYNLHISRPDTTTQYVEPGDYVVFEVTDTGPGIAREHIDHIFEPFFSKKKTGSSGTGLGLSIVYNTALDHGGTVTVKNTSQGTRFCLFLPACRDEVTVTQTSALEEELFGSGEKVLIIDDEPQQLDIARMMLEKLGYSCATAASGEEGINRLEQEEFALILLDMIMHPGIGGGETYRAILERRPGQKAIIVSGFSENEDVTHTLDMGAGTFVRKPYSMHTLASAIKEVLL